MKDARHDAGLTLIELVIAMSIFALVAVMGLQTLTVALRSRDKLAEIESQTAELNMAVGLIRADLGAVVPMLFRPAGQTPGSAVDFDPSRALLGLSVGGQYSLPFESGAGLKRVEWQFDTSSGTLRRVVWPSVYPVADAVPSPAMPVIEGVRSWSIRSYWPDLGWVSGTDGIVQSAPAAPSTADTDGAVAAAPELYVSILPEALELTLGTTLHGEITIVESFK